MPKRNAMNTQNTPTSQVTKRAASARGSRTASQVVTRRLAKFNEYLERSYLVRDWEGGPVLQAWRETVTDLIAELEAMEG